MESAQTPVTLDDKRGSKNDDVYESQGKFRCDDKWGDETFKRFRLNETQTGIGKTMRWSIPIRSYCCGRVLKKPNCFCQRAKDGFPFTPWRLVRR